MTTIVADFAARDAWLSAHPGGLAAPHADGWECWTAEERPALPPAEQEPRLIETRDFRDRMSTAEWDAILDLSDGGDKLARRAVFKLQTQPTINLDSAELIGLLDYFTAQGALAAGRAAQLRA